MAAARRSVAAAGLVGVLSWCAAHGVASAQDQRRSFEVATIRPSGADSGPISIRRLPGGRLITSNTSLPMLISWAFNLDDGRLVGVPGGLDSVRFDVVAKAPVDDPAPGQVQLMMRAFLAERFKLVVHSEKRELTAYSLVVDRGGTKVRVSTTREAPDANPFSMTSSGTLSGRRVTTDMLAKVLSSQLGRPVEDMTGFTDPFDFVLQWTPDATAGGAERDYGSFFTAIREQLGFRLVARRMPIEVIAIDHVDPSPTEN